MGASVGTEIIRSWQYEWLDSCHVAGRERSCLDSLGNALIDIAIAFRRGESVDVQPLCCALQELTDTCLDISELERSFSQIPC